MLIVVCFKAHQSNRVCNALALLQCVASHPETRSAFLQGTAFSCTYSLKSIYVVGQKVRPSLFHSLWPFYFWKSESNKLRFHAEDEITFFYSKFGADLTNMYTVTSCKMKWPTFLADLIVNAQWPSKKPIRCYITNCRSWQFSTHLPT